MNLLHLQVRIEIGKLLHFLRHQGISGMIGLLPVFKHPKKCEVRLRQRLVAVFSTTRQMCCLKRLAVNICEAVFPLLEQVPMVDGSHGGYSNTTLKNFIGKLMQHIMIFGVHESMSP
jgi:hypothetical protein